MWTIARNWLVANKLINIKIFKKIAYNYLLFIALTVTSLTPGKEYKFRVTAVNAEGESEPLQTEESIIAKNPFGNTVIYLFLIISKIFNEFKLFR